MLYLTCTTITSVDLAHYGVSRAKDWVSVDCGTKYSCLFFANECVSVFLGPALYFSFHRLQAFH